MGLFDFVKDVGRQVFNTDSEAADNIREHLEIKTSGIKNITVEFDDGVATICGDCVNQATRDNAVLMVGNIKGVEKSNCRRPDLPGTKTRGARKKKPKCMRSSAAIRWVASPRSTTARHHNTHESSKPIATSFPTRTRSTRARKFASHSIKEKSWT